MSKLDVPRDSLLDPSTVYTCRGCGCDAITSGDFPYCSYPCKVRHNERRSRPCDVCPHTAWLVTVGPDGFGHYQCNQGHLLIVAQPKQGAA